MRESAVQNIPLRASSRCSFCAFVPSLVVRMRDGMRPHRIRCLWHSLPRGREYFAKLATSQVRLDTIPFSAAVGTGKHAMRTL
mmetsp:Transcript_82340/g.266618  ORF Transcript_82340/g.266618 Transcript_82340/m.266618 type:complete len:83 (+) Transcript_82340:1059-1307(+)